LKSNHHRNRKNIGVILISCFISLVAFVNQAHAQAEVEAWGNIEGIRSHGQLFELGSNLTVVQKNKPHIVVTGREKQKPHFKRDGDNQIVASNIDSLFFTETVTDLSTGKIKVDLSLSAHSDIADSGVYFSINLPSDFYNDTQFHFTGNSDGALKNFASVLNNNYVDVKADGIEFSSKNRQLKIGFEYAAAVTLKKDTVEGKAGLQLLIALNKDGFKNGETTQNIFTIKTSGEVDKEPVKLSINTSTQGRSFDGLGGNFRLQNPKGDPQVIDYCLDNLRVAWARVELPWRFWQPNLNVNPTLTADSGKLHPAVKNAMVMAHRLDSMGIPIILSAWFPPTWAAAGKVNFRPVNGVWGNPLNYNNIDAIYKSIADYILYIKKKYGVEPKLFSFNESDLGINVRLTGQQHDDFIKGCGAYFAARGLKTKMLLGDNSDATTYKFIYPALNDSAARPYIGAISFHSWRGWDTPTLEKWADAAQRMKLPLIVGEGSTDAAAFSYPDIFQEPAYALNEINLYTRLLAICQPVSILQWQLTSDYSPLIGGGIFGNNDPLHPGQRFWNLKQLSITPKGLFSMPITSDKSNVTCAAMGDNARGVYAVHLVNNGSSRKAILTGLPSKIKSLKIYSTSKDLNFKDGGSVDVVGGTAEFKMPAACYVTLISE